MTISSYNDLRTWFERTTHREEGDGHYWSLFSVGIGGKDTLITKNDREPNLEKSFEWLVETIRIANNPHGSIFRVYKTWKPSHNVPSGEVRVQIFEGHSMLNNATSPGIAGFPAMQGFVAVGDMEKAIAAAVKESEMQRRIADLENALENPGDWVDKVITGIERIAQTPFGEAIAANLFGGQQPTGMARMAMNGTPGRVAQAAPAPKAQESEEEEDPEKAAADDEKFNQYLVEICETLETDDLAVMAALHRLVKKNPAMAKALINQN